MRYIKKGEAAQHDHSGVCASNDGQHDAYNHQAKFHNRNDRPRAAKDKQAVVNHDAQPANSSTRAVAGRECAHGDASKESTALKTFCRLVLHVERNQQEVGGRNPGAVIHAAGYAKTSVAIYNTARPADPNKENLLGRGFGCSLSVVRL